MFIKLWKILLFILLCLSICQFIYGHTINNTLTFQALNGSNVSLTQYQGQVIIISFSAKGIPLTQFELPQLEKLATKFTNEQVAVIWVSTNSSRQKSSAFASGEELEKFAKNYPHLTVLRDLEGNIFQKIGGNTLPTIFVLDQNGRMVGRCRVGIDPQANLVNDLTPTINKLLGR